MNVVSLLVADPTQSVKVSIQFILNCAIPQRTHQLMRLRELLDLDPIPVDVPGLVIDRLLEHIDRSIFQSQEHQPCYL